MSKVVDSFPRRTNSRAAKYPFDQWANGEVWALEPEVDFDTSIASVRAALHAYGKSVGIKFRTIYQDEVLYVQALPAPEEVTDGAK